MKKKAKVTGIFAATVVTLSAMALQASEIKHANRIQHKGDAAELSRMAKIPMESAIITALQKVPGSAMRAELENENGQLVYTIEVAATDHQTMDVMVDADNGLILKVDQDQQDKEWKDMEENDGEHENHDGQGEKEE